MGWSWLPLLFPFLYSAARTRMETCCALLYYLGATWPVVPGARAFFAGKDSLLGNLALWMGISLLGAAPWILLYSRRWIEASALLSLLVLALPPLSLVTVAYPLTAAGFFFPGTKWIGLGFPAVVLLARRFLGWSSVLVLLTAAAGIAHWLYQKPTQNPAIVTVNTQFGGTAFEPHPEGAVISPVVGQEMFIRKTALAHPRAVVLFPETSIPDWSQGKDAYWKAFFEQLEQQQTSVLIGTTVPIPNTPTASRNILLSRGFGPHFAYVQRVPVPLGMWQIGGDGRDGFPLMLIYPPTIRVRDHRAAVLICYEQLIAWTALQSLAHNPDFILAPSNTYWARKTIIPAIQQEAVQNWAALWGIPAYEATNQ
jgi:Carbon-nitrogen hydrolase